MDKFRVVDRSSIGSSVGKVVMKLGRVCSKFGASLALVLGLAVPAGAEPPEASAPEASSPSSTNLIAGPSLYETGKVGVLPDSAPDPAPTPVPAEL
jgi:hypothetical protein